MWAFFRPYTGIRHDAWLYMLDAVFGDDPAFQAADIWVAFDPQSDWSGYSMLLTSMLRWWSPATVGIVAAGAGLLAWIGACFVFGRATSPRRWWIPGLVVVAGSPRYGGWGVFAFAEPFAAPRALSEALVIASIGLLLCRRRLWSLFAIGIATLLHPLVALPGIVVVLLMWWDPRTLRHILGVLGLAVAGGLLVWWDPLRLGAAAGGSEWLAIIESRSPYLFLTAWDWGAWLRLAMSTVVVLAVVFDRGQSRLRGFFRCILTVGFLGVGASFVLGDLLESPFALQLQLWRSIWLLHVGALFAVAALAARLLETRDRRQLAQVLAAVLMLSIPASVPGVEAWLTASVLASLTIAFGHPWTERQLGSVVRVFNWLAAAGILGIFVAQVSWVVHNPVDRDLSAFLAVFPGAGFLAAAILGWGVETVRNDGWFARCLVFLLAVIAIAVTVRWDGRSDWTRYTETLDEPVIATDPDAVVLVEDPEFGARFIFGRPEYFTREAGSGVVFSSALALAYEDRRRNVAEIGLLGSDPSPIQIQDVAAIGPPDVGGLVGLCSAQQGPTVLLLRRQSDELPGEMWTPPVAPVTVAGASSAVSRTGFYLYTCDAVLSYQEAH